MTPMLHSPFARALGLENKFTYQDYLYELFADGYNGDQKPISEWQWEMLCDMKGKRDLYYASNSKAALEDFERSCVE